jgi:hypothetical protein
LHVSAADCQRDLECTERSYTCEPALGDGAACAASADCPGLLRCDPATLTCASAAKLATAVGTVGEGAHADSAMCPRVRRRASAYSCHASARPALRADFAAHRASTAVPASTPPTAPAPRSRTMGNPASIGETASAVSATRVFVVRRRARSSPERVNGGQLTRLSLCARRSGVAPRGPSA